MNGHASCFFLSFHSRFRHDVLRYDVLVHLLLPWDSAGHSLLVLRLPACGNKLMQRQLWIWHDYLLTGNPGKTPAP